MRSVFVSPAADPDEWDVVAVPDRMVVADVSGRVPGHAQVRRLVLALLARGGVAADDRSDRLWSAAQIEGGGFFDG